MRRRVIHALLGLSLGGAVLTLLSVALLLYLRLQPGPPANGRVSVKALRAPVTLTRDPLGVPHISARSVSDAFLALGYAHAQDRFWQMEMMRRSAHGTLSELFGKRTLSHDRLARTLRLSRLARNEWEAMSKRSRQRLEAYASGVNLYLSEGRKQRGAWPAELRWLGAEPEPWAATDTLVLARLRAWMLGRSLGATLLLDRLVREIGGVASQDFFPARSKENGDLMGSLLRLGETADELARAVGLHGPVGSLGFVVGASRSQDGFPLLANDPHVAFRLPPIYYVAHIETPGWQVSGGTWPGLPIFWTGTNGSIAWGQVAAHASVSDLFEETLHPEDPHLYDRSGRWRSVDRQAETIAVRGESDVEIEIVETGHGPLLGVVHPDDPSARSLALSWTGHGRRSGLEEMLKLQGAQNWEEFRGALQRFPAPVTTFLYADAGGQIGSQLAGLLPLRAIETGLLPVPGRSRYYDWRGFIPFEKLPSRHGRDLPYLVASTRPDNWGLSRSIAWLWEAGGSEERLRELFARGKRLRLRDVLEMQRDRFSQAGPAAVRALLAGVKPAPGPSARIYRILMDWDGSTKNGSVGVSAYHIFRQRLGQHLLESRLEAELVAQIVEASEPLPGVVLARFVDRAGPDEGSAVVARALVETWNSLSSQISSNPKKWNWGRVHQLHLRHDFERLGPAWLRWVGRSLGRGPFPVPGDPDSVWTMHHQAVPTVDVAVGPAFRYAVDLADMEHAQFGLAGGQSGHPDSPHYDDALEAWLRGEPRPLWMHFGDIAHQAHGVWRLEPEGQ